LRGDRRGSERAGWPIGLRVGREQIADVGARVADRAHLPVEHGEDPRRRLVGDHRVAEAKVAVHDDRRQRIGHALREPSSDLVDRRHLPRLVDLPEL